MWENKRKKYDSENMNRMFRSLDLFVLSCLFLSESQTGQILPPQNLSALWISDFELRLSWAPPQHAVGNCNYDVKSNAMDEIYSGQTSPWQSKFIVMEGGVLQMSVETVCNGARSEPALFNIMYPELVNKLECCIFSSNQSRCSWLPASQAPDLRFFYALQNEDLETSINNDALSVLQECSLYSSYSYTNSTRTGCDLQTHIKQAIIILFNGTLNNKPVRNTFRKDLNKCVKLPPLEWTVTKTEDKFIINWVAPDLVSLPYWKFQINYTECNDRKVKDVEGNTTVDLALVPHCPYHMAIKAETQGGWKINTTGIDEKYFDADTDPKAILILTSIIIPLMFAGLAVLTFMYCSKNKEKIFPKVPQPQDLLSDISDNNNKSTVHNLYIPAEEEDNCKITLVIDPQTNQI